MVGCQRIHDDVTSPQLTFVTAPATTTHRRVRYDLLLESDAGPHPRHFSTIYADADDQDRRLVREKWLEQEPELRLQLVRLDDDDRLVRVPLQK
jgi:hypothetical protein